MGKTLALVDYGAGNLRSVENAFRYLGVQTEITGDPARLNRADGVVLPGVGAFGAAMAGLQQAGLVEVVRALALNPGKPFLGICLGMQALFSSGSEGAGRVPGLGVIPGRVEKMDTREKLPQIGWNELRILQKDCPLFAGLPEGAYVYFVHSYAARPENRARLAATTDYGMEVPAVVWRREENVIGCQFHPEKSGDAGLWMLRNFANFL